MCPILEVEADNVRIWDYHNRYKSQLLENLDKTLTECTIIHNQCILFEEKLENGEWPQQARDTRSFQSGWGSSSSSYGGGSNYNNYNNRGREPSDPGICGLSNLGNTCFMNSSLQSLSNCPKLTKFFLQGEYRKDINRDNPLGTGGELVEQYASLLRDIWSGEYRYIIPREFKGKLERFAPQFQGMQQHDSQELLGYLLDGLHEDLNRIRNKPYIELKEADGREDSVVANESWQNHLARNNSVIVDWYQGQLKSKLTCPDCDRVSVTFDPCMYLSLPLPGEKTRKVKVTIRLKDKIPLERVLKAPKYGTIADLKKSVVNYLKENQNQDQQFEIPATENLVAFEIWHHKIYKTFLDNENLDKIQERDIIHVVWVPSPEKRIHSEPQKDDDDDDDDDRYHHHSHYYNHHSYKPKPKFIDDPNDIVHVNVILRKVERTMNYNHRQIESIGIFGVPTVIAVPRGISYKELHKVCAQYIERYFDDPSILNFPEQNNNEKSGELDSSDNNNNNNNNNNATATNNNPDDDDNEYSSTKRTPIPSSTTTDDVVMTDTNNNNQQQEQQQDINDKSSQEGNEENSSSNQQQQQQNNNNADSDDDDDDDANGYDSVSNYRNNKYPDSDDDDDDDRKDDNENSIRPPFIIEILDIHAQKRAREFGFNDHLNFGTREMISITFTDELVPHYKLTEENWVDKEDQQDDDDENDNSIDLFKCISLFTTEEQLGPEDPWYCNKCKDHKQAAKKFDLWKLPPLLVIHLKRFSYQRAVFLRRDKIDSVVKFPLTDLDLSEYVIDPDIEVPPIYDLMAVSVSFFFLKFKYFNLTDFLTFF